MCPQFLADEFRVLFRKPELGTGQFDDFASASSLVATPRRRKAIAVSSSNKASFTISGAGVEMAPRHKPPRHTPDDEHVLVDDDLLDEVTDDHR